MIIKLYKVTVTKGYSIYDKGKGFSFYPWGGNDIYFEGYDDGGKEYLLPEEFEVAIGKDEQLHIYDKRGDYYEILNYKGRPAIILRGEGKLTTLKEVQQ